MAIQATKLNQFEFLFQSLIISVLHVLFNSKSTTSPPPPLQDMSIFLKAASGVITQSPAVWPWSFHELAGVMQHLSVVCEPF